MMASPRLFTGKSRPRPGEDERILPLINVVFLPNGWPPNPVRGWWSRRMPLRRPPR